MAENSINLIRTIIVVVSVLRLGNNLVRVDVGSFMGDDHLAYTLLYHRITNCHVAEFSFELIKELSIIKIIILNFFFLSFPLLHFQNIHRSIIVINIQGTYIPAM